MVWLCMLKCTVNLLSSQLVTCGHCVTALGVVLGRLHQRTLLPGNVAVSGLVNYTNHPQPRWNPSTVLNRKSSQRKILCPPTVLSFYHSVACLSLSCPLSCEVTQADSLLNNSRHLVRQLRQSRRTLRDCGRQQGKRKRANTVVTVCVSDPAYPHYHWTHFSWTCLGFVSLVSPFTPYFMFIYLSQPLIFMPLCHCPFFLFFYTLSD